MPAIPEDLVFLLSHPTGNSNVRQVLRALSEFSGQTHFFTTLGFSRQATPLLNRLPSGLKKQLSRRSYDINREQLHYQPFREAFRVFFHGRVPRTWTQNEGSPFSIDTICQKLDATVAAQLQRLQPRAAYFYEDAAAESLQTCRRLGIPSFYELPIAYGSYARKILETEMERYPEWAPTLTGLQDSGRKMERKRLELELADHVIVPSNFVAQSLPEEIAREKKSVFINPYGADIPPLRETISPEPDASTPLRVLFVGGFSQRKGLADLFSACRCLDKEKIELHLLGHPIVPLSFYRQQCPIEFIHHPPCSRSEVLEIMAQSDVLVLPSLVEGRALVQLEALSQGLPLIITPNTGGDDLVMERETGFIVPIRSPESIAEKLSLLADDRELLAFMKKRARQRAMEATWEQYRNRLLDHLKNTLGLS